MRKHKVESLAYFEAVSALLLVFFLASYRVFDRCIIYHDEIINLNKANISWFLDYAARPIYYASNILVIHLLGNRWESLVVASLGYVICYTAIVFFIIHRFFKKPLLITSAAFCLLGNSLFFREALAAMPHSFSALVATLTICTYFVGNANKHKSLAHSVLWGALLGTTEMLLLLSHPTMIAILVPLFILVSYDLVVALRRKQLTRPSALFPITNVLFWLLGFAAANLVYLNWDYYETSYVHYWTEGLTKVASPEYSKYHHPYNFYFLAVFEDYRWLLTWSGVLLIPLLAYGRRMAAIKAAHLESPLKAIFIALCSLAVISVSEWKFLRVLSALLPVLALGLTGLAALILTMHEHASNQNRHTKLLNLTLLIAVIIPAANAYRASVDDALLFWSKKRHTYTDFYNTLSLLNGDYVCYPGDKTDAEMRRVIVQARAVGKELLRINPWEEWASVDSLVSEKRCSSIVLHKEDYPESANTMLLIKNAGYQLQRTYLKQFDLWTRTS